MTSFGILRCCMVLRWCSWTLKINRSFPFFDDNLMQNTLVLTDYLLLYLAHGSKCHSKASGILRQWVILLHETDLVLWMRESQWKRACHYNYNSFQLIYLFRKRFNIFKHKNTLSTELNCFKIEFQKQAAKTWC